MKNRKTVNFVSLLEYFFANSSPFTLVSAYGDSAGDSCPTMFFSSVEEPDTAALEAKITLLTPCFAHAENNLSVALTFTSSYLSGIANDSGTLIFAAR